jgi:acetyl-CoA acetyltransferase family protein
MGLRDQSIVILDGGRRTPRADILHKNQEPGLFSGLTTTQLGGLAARATLAATKLDPGRIGHVIMGMAQHSHRDSIYGAQGMRWRGGLGHDVPALTVSRLCGSGVEAIALCAEMILAGVRHDRARPFYLVGGAESMQYPFCLYNARGQKQGESVHKYGPIDAKNLPAGSALQDMLLMSLYDPSAKMAMANTAEELGRRHRVTRAMADAFALRSHTLAKQAREQGAFETEIAPVTVQKDGAATPVEVKHDTHIIDDASLAKMARLKPAFEPGGVITAANASAVVDGAAAMIVGPQKEAERLGCAPLARVAGVGVAALDPSIMGYGPVPATQMALENAGLRGSDIAHVELNEAFAPQALACIHGLAELGIAKDAINPLGGAIALGHPLGATGAILTLTCAYALRRKKQRYGLVTLCIGGGQGIALVLEAI